MSSMISFFSRTISGSGFNFYHMWKLRCQGCGCTPFPLQTGMWKELNVRKVNGIVYGMLSMKNQCQWKIFPFNGSFCWHPGSALGSLNFFSFFLFKWKPFFGKSSCYGTFKKYVRSRFPSFVTHTRMHARARTHTHTHTHTQVHSLCLKLTLSPSVSIPVKCREKKEIMSTSIFGWTQRVFQVPQWNLYKVDTIGHWCVTKVSAL